MAKRVTVCEHGSIDDKGGYNLSGCETQWVEDSVPGSLFTRRPVTAGDAESQLKAIEGRLTSVIGTPQTERKCCMSETKQRTKEQVLEAMNAEADKLRASEPKLTREQAFARVMDQQPKLYGEYLTAPDAVREPERPRSAQEAYPGAENHGPATRLVLTEWYEKANEIRTQRPELTVAQAFCEVPKRWPNANDRYAQALEIDRRNRR